MRSFVLYPGCGIRNLFILTVLIMVGTTSADAQNSTVTNRPIPLLEILKKWKPLSLSDITAAAEGGDLTAQHYLGYYHYEGAGGKADQATGLQWYSRAASAGFPNSLNNLAQLYRYGNGVKKDEAKALELLREAVAKDFPVAMRNLAEMIARQPDGAKQKQDLRLRLESLAREGIADAQIQLAHFVLNPPGGGYVETENAVYLLGKAAQQGRPDAYTALGDLYLEGHGKTDYAKALEWYRRGAEMGQASSEVSLGWMYFNGLGVPADTEKAYEWVSKAAARNHSPAVVNMGRFYAGDRIPNLPRGFRPDYVKAAEWYSRAITLENAWGYYYLGRLIWEEKVPGRDRQEAIALLQKAGERSITSARELVRRIQIENAAGTAGELQLLEEMALDRFRPAMARLARKFQQGEGVPRDYVKATFFYLRARDEEEAQMALLVVDENGQPRAGLGRDETEFARVVSQVLAGLKQPGTTFFREQGIRYQRGEGVPKDDLEAAVWLTAAAKGGDTEAQKLANEVTSRLNEKQKAAMEEWVITLRDAREILSWDNKQ